MTTPIQDENKKIASEIAYASSADHHNEEADLRWWQEQQIIKLLEKHQKEMGEERKWYEAELERHLNNSSHKIKDLEAEVARLKDQCGHPGTCEEWENAQGEIRGLKENLQEKTAECEELNAIGISKAVLIEGLREKLEAKDRDMNLVAEYLKKLNPSINFKSESAVLEYARMLTVIGKALKPPVKSEPKHYCKEPDCDGDH